jgi:hypothetical protein
VLAFLNDANWVAIGAFAAGIGSLLSGIGAYKLAQRQREHIGWEEAHESEAGGADRER